MDFNSTATCCTALYATFTPATRLEQHHADPQLSALALSESDSMGNVACIRGDDDASERFRRLDLGNAMRQMGSVKI